MVIICLDRNNHTLVTENAEKNVFTLKNEQTQTQRIQYYPLMIVKLSLERSIKESLIDLASSLLIEFSYSSKV